jgi:steroid delta-isomerase-like uncharacterized protein
MKIFRSALVAPIVIACGSEPAAQQPASRKVEPAPVASSAATPPPEPPAPKLPMPEMQKKTLLAMLNERNPELLLPLYTKDAVKRMPMPEGWKEIRGNVAIAKQVDELNNRVGPTVTWTRSRVIMKNEHTVAEYIVSGTRDGKKIGVRGLVIHAFDAQGRIKREDIYIDLPSVMIQTGRIPGKSEPAPDPVGEAQWIAATNEAAEEKNAELLKSKWPEAWQKKDKKAFEAILADDYVQEDIAWGMTFKGKTAAAKGMESFTKAVPDLSITVDETWAAGDVVVAAMTMKGTQRGELGPVKPTNKPFTTHVVTVADVKGDKLAKASVYMNSMEILGQLGVLKPEAKPKADEKK